MEINKTNQKALLETLKMVSYCSLNTAKRLNPELDYYTKTELNSLVQSLENSGRIAELPRASQYRMALETVYVVTKIGREWLKA